MQSQTAELPLLDQLWATFEKHRQRIIGGAVLLALVALVGGFVSWRQGQKAVEASEAVSNVVFPELVGQKADLSAPLLKLASEYSGTKAGQRASLMAAASLFVNGKYSESQSQFEKFTRDYRDSPYLAQALLGVGSCLDAQGKTNEAVTAYKNLIERQPTQIVIPQAKFALARLYEATGRPELARPLFEDLTRNDPYGSITSEAGMRLEELRLQRPDLFVPPSAPVLPTPTPVPVSNAVPAAPAGSNAVPR